jgi:hypothetical protein
MPGQVTVACKLPNGLILRVFDMIEKSESPVGAAPRTVREAASRAGSVTLKGCAAPYGTPKLLHGGYALTHGVDADFFEAWMAQNKEHPAVKAGLIFAHAKSDMAQGKAKEQAEIRSGLEPLKQKGDPRAPKRPSQHVSDIEPAQAA